MLIFFERVHTRRSLCVFWFLTCFRFREVTGSHGILAYLLLGNSCVKRNYKRTPYLPFLLEELFYWNSPGAIPLGETYKMSHSGILMRGEYWISISKQAFAKGICANIHISVARVRFIQVWFGATGKMLRNFRRLKRYRRRVRSGISYVCLLPKSPLLVSSTHAMSAEATLPLSRWYIPEKWIKVKTIYVFFHFHPFCFHFELTFSFLFLGVYLCPSRAQRRKMSCCLGSARGFGTCNSRFGCGKGV